jgi:DNA-binding SARP family transcriptional activator
MEKETMETANPGQEAQQPLLRVFLLGEFRLVWQATPFTQDALWNSRTSARTLFKLLLCAPGRQASRSQLAGILWPETDEGKARESLRQARNVLRKMLRTAHGEELLEQRNHGELLKLAEQARIWVDADAFEECVAQASRAATADEALHLWQQAQALLSGEFLTEDQNAEWIRHRWVRQRRQALWLARSRMVRHLSDLYLQCGQHILAEEVLEQHLAHFPTDQDALYRLLALLEEQGWLEEARLVYERTQRSLESLGKQPAQHVRVRYEHIQQAMITLQGNPLRQRASEPRGPAQPSLPPIASSRLPGRELGSSHLPVSHTSKGEPFLLEEVDPPHAPWEILRMVFQTEPEGRPSLPLVSRRQLLELGIAALLSQLAQLDRKRMTALDREELAWALSRGVADGWRQFLLLPNADILAMSRLQLSLIHQAHPLLEPLTRSYLYAGAYGLVGLALHQREHLEDALQAYHNGHLAALATGDPWYVAQSLICQADAYLGLGRYAEALHTIEEALRGLGESDEMHRRARAHLLGCWADVAMTMEDYSLAHGKLDESARYLDNIDTLVEEFDRTCWLQLAGKRALMAGEYQQATQHLEAALAANPSHWLVRQAGILLPLCMAYARLRDQDRTLSIGEQALPVISAVNAPMTNRHFLAYLQDDLVGRFPGDRKIEAFLRKANQQLPHLPILTSRS